MKKTLTRKTGGVDTLIRPLFLIALSSLFPPSIFASSDLATADFLNLTFHARPLGLGEAATAEAGGLGLAAVNPAAVSTVEKREFSFSHGILVEDSTFEHFAFGYGAGGHVLAVSYLQLSHGSLERRDASGLVLGSFTPRDSALALTYGTRWRRLALGAAVKQVKSKIVKEADAVSMDAGAQYEINGELDAGVSLLNAFGELTFDQKADPLPRTARAGTRWTPADKVHLMLDAVYPFYADFYTALGGEYRFVEKDHFGFALRGGYNTKTPDLEGFSGLNGGLGLRVRRLEVNYALDPYGDFGLTHRVSVDYAW